MKKKHLEMRIQQCLILAQASNCPRRKFGAMLLDPLRNVVLADGYNGGPRGAEGALCSGHTCERNDLQVKSGTRMEVGCHHAEANVICNAASGGVSTQGQWLIVTGEPCKMCAKLIHHAGIKKVVVVNGGYSGTNGIDYLQQFDVEIEFVDGPKDPR